MPATDSPPTIAFDGAVLGAGPITGVAGSFMTTLRAYAARTTARCVLLTPRSVEAPDIPGVEVVDGPSGRWRRQGLLAATLRKLGASLLHCPIAAIPLRAPCPVIATIHDLPWMADLPASEPGRGALDRFAVRLAARRAAAILTPTEASAADLVRFLGPRVRPRIAVVPHGVASVSSPADDEELDGPFLVLGDDRPRKNRARIEAAHDLALRRTKELPDLRFVGPGSEYLIEADKLTTLRRSRALLQLSLHEGFGIPVVEAFAHGVPVLCSSIPSLIEVADGAALHVDPTSVDAMAAAMVRIHQSADLRRALRAAGTRRAAALTPEDSAVGWQAAHARILTTPELAEA